MQESGGDAHDCLDTTKYDGIPGCSSNPRISSIQVTIVLYSLAAAKLSSVAFGTYSEVIATRVWCHFAFLSSFISIVNAWVDINGLVDLAADFSSI
jgi:hypothetical protein